LRQFSCIANPASAGFSLPEAGPPRRLVQRDRVAVETRNFVTLKIFRFAPKSVMEAGFATA
jgi:hypothetical protein